MDKWIGLVPAMPMLAAAWIAGHYILVGNGGEAAEKITQRIAIWSVSLALSLLLLLDLLALVRGNAPGHIRIGCWLQSGTIELSISFMLDRLGLTMATLVAVLSLLTLRFSVYYLHREAGFQRYFMIISLFIGAMLLLVMAGSPVLAFVGWELAGVCSYLLIGYTYNRPTAVANAIRVKVTNAIGDIGFILAMVLTLLWVGPINWTELLAASQTLPPLPLALIGAGFLLAALVKSAQVPFTPWIARALEGPTPSSTLFYGALLVHAGVYLLIRLAPIWEQNPSLMLVMAVLGATTALYGFLVGLVQTDIKSGLIFATIGQVGLMFLQCGLGWFQLATWHLVAHAIWRAFQFLSAPGLMHAMGRASRPVPRWLQTWRWLYVASLQRFWLDNIANWFLIKPTWYLAQDVRVFDQQVVNRLVGLPRSASAVSSLAQWEKLKLDKKGSVDGDSGGVGPGQGAMGHLMERVATALAWFEEHLVIRGGEQGILQLIQHLGRILEKIETLLSLPRYLYLLVMATFVVIL